MNWHGTQFQRRAILACAALSVISLPLLAWAQGSTPPATPPATPAASDATPATPATPAAPATPATPATPAAAAAPHPATMSDSGRAAFRAEVAHELKEMGDSMKVTPQQKAMVRPILLDQAYMAKQLKDKYAAMERTPANREAMMKEMQTLRESGDARLAMVLSGDQMTQWKRMRDEKLAKYRTRMGGGAAPPAEKK